MPKEFFIEQPTKKETESKLKELEKYPDLRPRLTVAWPVDKEKEELLEMVNTDAEELTKKENLEKIEELRENNDFVKRGTTSYLDKKIEQKQNKLFKLFKHDKKIKLSEKILSSRKPMFTAHHNPELAKKILLLEDVSRILQEKYEDRFIGFVVFGSTARGYSRPKSDIDYMLIGSKAEDAEIHNEFESLVRDFNLEPCCLYQKYTDVKTFTTVRDAGQLFQGLFFGNRKKLLELQKQVLEKINKTKWDEIRSGIATDETELGKTAKRLKIGKQKLKQVKANIALLRTPPPLEEAREIINKRYEQEMRKKKKE